MKKPQPSGSGFDAIIGHPQQNEICLALDIPDHPALLASRNNDDHPPSATPRHCCIDLARHELVYGSVKADEAQAIVEQARSHSIARSGAQDQVEEHVCPAPQEPAPEQPHIHLN